MAVTGMSNVFQDLLSAVANVLRSVAEHGPIRDKIDPADWEDFITAHDKVLDDGDKTPEAKVPPAPKPKSTS